MYFKIDVIGDRHEQLQAALEMIFTFRVSSKSDNPCGIECWSGVEGRLRLFKRAVLDKHTFPLPAPIRGAETAATLVWDWLRSTDYPEDPNSHWDGTSLKGFRVHSDYWETDLFCTIEPHWVFYAK